MVEEESCNIAPLLDQILLNLLEEISLVFFMENGVPGVVVEFIVVVTVIGMIKVSSWAVHFTMSFHSAVKAPVTLVGVVPWLAACVTVSVCQLVAVSTIWYGLDRARWLDGMRWTWSGVLMTKNLFFVIRALHTHLLHGA